MELSKTFLRGYILIFHFFLYKFLHEISLGLYKHVYVFQAFYTNEENSNNKSLQHRLMLFP